MKKKRYPSDLTHRQWNLIKGEMPAEKERGRKRSVDLRSVVNALLYMSRGGCQWRMLPKDFPHWRTVYGYFARWRDDGTFEEITRILRESVRVKANRNKRPTAALMDSQTVKTTGVCEQQGYDGHKRIKGRKRHIAVDVLGLLLMVIVHSAGLQDRAGARLLIPEVMKRFPSIERFWADGGYEGKTLLAWVIEKFKCILEIVKRPRKRFQIVKWRWIVERTFGWFNFHRRLSKDYEYYTTSSEAWIRIAAISQMIHRLRPG